MTMTDDPTVAITTYVPQSLAISAQAAFAEALQTLLTRPGAAVGTAAADGSAFVALDGKAALTLYPDVWAAPAWTPQDTGRITWLVGSLDGTNLAGLLRGLVAVTGGGDADALLATGELAYAKRSIPTALKHLAGRCRQASRRPMWTYTDNQYAMDLQLAAAFTAALTG